MSAGIFWQKAAGPPQRKPEHDEGWSSRSELRTTSKSKLTSTLAKDSRSVLFESLDEERTVGDSKGRVDRQVSVMRYIEEKSLNTGPIPSS
jgi:hypothetical protein